MVSSQLTFSQAPPLTLENLLTTALLFSSLAQRQMSLKMQLTQNICVLDSVPTVCFPVLLPPAFWSFLKIENTVLTTSWKRNLQKKKKNTHSATSLTNIAISTPTILLLILHVHSFLPVYIIFFFFKQKFRHFVIQPLPCFFPDSGTIFWFLVLSYRKGFCSLSAFCHWALIFIFLF